MYATPLGVRPVGAGPRARIAGRGCRRVSSGMGSASNTRLSGAARRLPFCHGWEALVCLLRVAARDASPQCSHYPQNPRRDRRRCCVRSRRTRARHPHCACDRHPEHPGGICRSHRSCRAAALIAYAAFDLASVLLVGALAFAAKPSSTSSLTRSFSKLMRVDTRPRRPRPSPRCWLRGHDDARQRALTEGATRFLGRVYPSTCSRRSCRFACRLDVAY
jgi:hypothetical protein